MYKTDPTECVPSPRNVGAKNFSLLHGRNQRWDPDRPSGCKNPARPGSANGAPSAQLAHSLRLDGLRDSGCQFHLDDLTAGEWMGLEALREYRAISAREAREKTV